MSKNTIKKIILTIIILSILIVSLVFFFRITSEDYKDDVSIVKKIIKEKYEEVKYFDNSYLYAYNNHEYIVFDYNGNKLYSFNSLNKLDVITISKKYFITKDNKYHLYNTNYEELYTGNNIYGINEYLIFADNNIIDYKGKVLFKGIKNINLYYKDKYISLDNYFINEKGKVLLYDYKIVREKINDNELDYFIVRKDNKYYSFFPIMNNIIGDEFDKYFEYKDDIYIVSNNKIYIISTNGLRKEITFSVNKNIYNIDYKNAVRKNMILTIRDYYLGILETDTNKFHRIIKTKNFTYKYIDNSNININCNGKNYVYNLDSFKLIYNNNFDDIVIFENNYKTLKNNDYYYLLDNDDRRIVSSDKQIILSNSKVKVGTVDSNINVFDNGLYNGESFIINGKIYYKYEKNDYKYIISSDLKEKYESKTFLSSMKDTIALEKNNKLYFYNKAKNKTYTYDLKDYKIKNNKVNKNEIILSNNKDIIVIGRKGNTIKRIKNVKINEINYNKKRQAIIIIVEKNKFNKIYNGAYVLK